MNKNDLKKAIYLAKPIAKFQFINKGSAIYKTDLNGKEISFDIPLSDMGTSEFLLEMEAKHLLRWIMTSEQEVV